MKLICPVFLAASALLAGCVYGPYYDDYPYEESADKALVCHKGKTLSVGEPAVDAHLKHGDYLGPCGRY